MLNIFYWTCTLLVITTKETESLKSVEIKVPEYVKANDSVTLSCAYDLEDAALYTIKWYWDGIEFYRFVPKESPPSKSFPVPNFYVDLIDSGANEVTLHRVKINISGVFKCEVSADAPLFHTELRDAVMNVIDVPSGAPRLEVFPSERAEIGKKIVATCAVSATKPAANVTWRINREPADAFEPHVRIRPTMRIGKLVESRMEIVAAKRHFAMGAMALRCDATLFDVWSSSAESLIVEDVAFLAPVLQSTSSLTHEDVFDYFGTSATLRYVPKQSVCFLGVIAVVFYWSSLVFRFAIE